MDGEVGNEGERLGWEATSNPLTVLCKYRQPWTELQSQDGRNGMSIAMSNPTLRPYNKPSILFLTLCKTLYKTMSAPMSNPT